MKRAILVIVAILLASLILPLVPQTADAASCTLATDAASNISYFWADLNGRVTAISDVSTVYTAFVWATTSYGDPGTLAPYNTDYANDPEGASEYYAAVHSDPFSFTTLASDIGAYLLANRTYYYRFGVYLGAPLNTWQYGPEVSFAVPLNPEGTCPFYGWSALSYSAVTTEAATFVESAVAEVRGTIGFVGEPYWWADYGFVYDTVSHANPSGWPDDWFDQDPAYCDYTYYVGVSSGAYGDLSYSCLLFDLDPGETYYYRTVADRQSGGDWIYGPEESFTLSGDCVVQDYIDGLPYEGDIWDDLDPISTDIWGAQNIVPVGGGAPPSSYVAPPSTIRLAAYMPGPDEVPRPSALPTPASFTVSAVSLKLWRSGTVSTVFVNVYLADDYTWYPVGDPLATGTADVSTLTTDTSGEWITVYLNAAVTFEWPAVYDLVVSSDGVFEYPDHMNCLVWVTTEEVYLQDYMNTYDDGENWNWPLRDALYILWCCPATSVANLYETWGYVPSTRPAWYQAFPSILKLLYVACIFLAAIFVYRQKPKKPEYPDMMGPEV
jgi:hypothetical protein